MMIRVPRQAARAAFTLMEMLVVVAIIVALAGIGGYYYFGQLEKANETKVRAQCKVIEQACKTYQINNNAFPPNIEVLLSPDDANAGKPYLEDEDAVRDPWGNIYQYDPNGSNNRGIKPDVWAETPRGPIGNWVQR